MMYIPYSLRDNFSPPSPRGIPFLIHRFKILNFKLSHIPSVEQASCACLQGHEFIGSCVNKYQSIYYYTKRLVGLFPYLPSTSTYYLTHCYNAYCTLHPDPYAEAKSRWEPGKTNRELDLRVISICCRCNYCSFCYSRILHPSGPRQPARILQGSALPCRLFADHRLPFRSLRPYSLTPLPIFANAATDPQLRVCKCSS